MDEVRKNIRKYAKDFNIPTLNELSKLADLAALTVAQFVLENADSLFKEVLRKDPALFVSVVKNELCDKNIKGLKWDDLIIRHEWKLSIKEFIETQSLTDEKKKLIMELTENIPCEFDTKIIENFESED